jgi:hypothetical protein
MFVINTIDKTQFLKGRRCLAAIKIKTTNAFQQVVLKYKSTADNCHLNFKIRFH